MIAAPNRDEPDGRLSWPKLAAVLAAVCEEVGLDPNNAQLIKFTNNAVFRLCGEPVVVRIAGSATMRARVPKVVSVAGWIAEHNLPGVRLLPGIEQPVRAGDHVATLWRFVPSTGPAPDGTDLGRGVPRA
jgi:hypothetical protein